MPCPHFDVKVIQRSKRQSAVASAAYQSGERLFSEYDQKQKYYSHKSEIVHTEIMLPPHAPPEYADRNTLWNAAEAAEKQWNSQLARRIVLAIPRELPPEQYAYLAAKRFFKAHQEELPFDTKELKKEREQLSGELSEKNEGLQTVQADMKLLRDVHYWINHVLPPDQRRVVPEPGKKPSLNEQLSWNIEGVKQREEQKRQQPRRQQKQDMEL